MSEIWDKPNGTAGTPADIQQQRVSATLTFGPITSSESARQAVLFQDATIPDEKWAIDGWNLYRYSGTSGPIESTIRFWTKSSAGTLFHQNVATLATNNDSAGEYTVNKSLALDDFEGLNISIQNSGGTDQLYKLTVWFSPRREN